MEDKKFTLLVNTSDGFEDCWMPFFTLLKRYWKDLDQPIVLNTEFKKWSMVDLAIESSMVHVEVLDRKLTWSECLIKVLSKLRTPLVLYMQEDYFLETPVNNRLIHQFADKMLNNPEIAYIGLTDIGNTGPFKPYSCDDQLWTVGNSKYRVSTQAALWRVDALLSYLRPEENGWMFEIFGTQRAKRRNDLFLTANRKIYSKANNAIMLYEHTGIIKGKWHKKMPSLFSKENIQIDFNKRGLYKPKPLILRKFETVKKLLRNPVVFVKGMMGR